MMKTEKPNSKIRTRAKQLTRQHRWTLTAVSVLALLPSILILVISAFMIEYKALNSLISFLLAVLLYPITQLGVTHVYFRTWHGNAPKLSMLLTFIQSEMVQKALLLGLIYNLIAQLYSLPQTLSGLFPENIAITMITTLTSPILAFVWIWITFRLILVPYIFCDSPEHKSGLYFRDSFVRMKGYIWRYIRLVIAAAWWRILIVIIIVLSPFPFVIKASLNNIEVPNYVFQMSTAAGLLIYSVLSPYVNLISAGFANKRMSAKSEK